MTASTRKSSQQRPTDAPISYGRAPRALAALAVAFAVGALIGLSIQESLVGQTLLGAVVDGALGWLSRPIAPLGI